MLSNSHYGPAMAGVAVFFPTAMGNLWGGPAWQCHKVQWRVYMAEFGLPPCSAIDNTGVNNDQLIPFFDYFVPTLANVLLIILYWLIFFLLVVLCLASILLIYAPVYMKVFLHWHCFYNVVMAGFYCMLGQYASTQSFALICTQFVYYLVICALQSFYQSCL